MNLLRRQPRGERQGEATPGQHQSQQRQEQKSDQAQGPEAVALSGRGMARHNRQQGDHRQQGRAFEGGVDKEHQRPSRRA